MLLLQRLEPVLLLRPLRQRLLPPLPSQHTTRAVGAACENDSDAKDSDANDSDANDSDANDSDALPKRNGTLDSDPGRACSAGPIRHGNRLPASASHLSDRANVSPMTRTDFGYCPEERPSGKVTTVGP